MSETSEALPQSDYELQKRRYFANTAVKVKSAFKMHKGEGLWERVDGKRDWGNVSEHCLVEVARGQIFADLLGFSPDLSRELMLAAGLHDFFKKGEKEIATASGLSWEAFDEAGRKSSEKLQEAGFSPRVVRLSGSVGHTSLSETEDILKKETLTQDDEAYLAMHYIDDYTVNAEWAAPASIDSDGKKVNEIDKRIDRNAANERYAKLNEEGRQHFNGETAFQAQGRIGHLVEERLAQVINARNNLSVAPLDLPEYIDGLIKAKISSQSVAKEVL